MKRYAADLVAARQASDQFEPRPNSYTGKIRCKVCLADGYPGGSWMDAHMRPHVECCGRMIPAGKALAHHRTVSHP